MAEAVMDAGAAARSSRKFYVWMAAICLAVAVLGFMPTYFLPIAQSRFRGEPIVHLHGLILFSWVSFFLVQTSLVAQGKTLAHRTWGVLGVSIATAMVFIVTWVVSMRIHQASLPGQPAGVEHQVKAFAWVSISALLFIVPVFVLAIANVRRPEVHKRLLLLMTVSMLAAPIARWFLTFLAPPPDPNAPPWPAGLPQVGAPPVAVSIGPSLVCDLLIIAAMVYDWRTRGRPHPVYLIGGAILLVVQLTVVPVSESPLWMAVATAIGRLAG